MSTAAWPTPRRGDRLGGRYELVREIGGGGSAIVFEAIDEKLGHRVAVKILRAPFAEEPEWAARFEREARNAAALRSVHTARILDVEASASSTPFIVSELLEGHDLARELRERGRLPVREAVAWVLQACEAIAEAHAAGLVHRDLKPSNLFLAKQGNGRTLKVLDFGIAKSSAEQDVTGAGAVLGTPSYMAPEQILDSRNVDARADVWALGVILFRALTGSMPFDAQNAEAAAVAALYGSPRRARELLPEIPDALDAAVAKALAHNPDDRFDTALDFARAIGPFALGQPPQARTNLGRDATPFFGRRIEIDELRKIFAEGARLVTLIGPGGVGKTRLARRHAELASEAYSGGVWFCDLSEARGLDDVWSAVGRSLGVTITGHAVSAEGVDAIGLAIAARGRVLVVLDNCEQIVEPVAAAVVRWRGAAPDARFLLTSRHLLELSGEISYEVAPMPAPEAVDLFVERARRARRGYELSGDAEIVGEIVRRLDGLPLAIELAAARIGVASAKTILERLSHRLDALGHGPRDAAARQRTLRSAIDWSWELLTACEQSALAQCSVFRGGFTLDAAERVLDLSGFDGKAPLDVIQALVEKSLLRATDADDVLRYGMLDTIREYAAEKLGASGREGEAFARHRAYYVTVAEAAQPDQLGVERDNLLAAFARALTSAAAIDDALRVLGALGTLYYDQGPWAPYLALLDRILSDAAIGHADPALRAKTLGQRGFLLYRVGKKARALEDLGAAATLAIGHDAARSRVLRMLANVERIEGRVDAARAHLEEAAALAERAGDRAALARAVGGIATLDYTTGRLDAAHRHCSEAIAIYGEIGDRNGRAMYTSLLGPVLQEQGDFDGARACLEEALAIHRETGDRFSAAWCLATLGAVAHERRDLREALSLYEQAVAMAHEVGDRMLEASIRAPLGALLGDLGEIEPAQRALDEADAVVRGAASNEALQVAIALYRLAIDLALARRSAAAGDAAGALERRLAVEKRIAAAETRSPPDDVRFALRLLHRALGDGSLASVACPELPNAATNALVVSADGAWCRAPGGTKSEVMGTSHRSLLLALVWHRLQAPKDAVPLEDLVRAGWPGEQMTPASATNRVHVALAALRKLGLRDVLLTRAHGYLLDPNVPLLVVQPDA